MFIQKLKLPTRYNPGTTIDTTGVLFHQDGSCMPLGRVIQIVPGISKEKVCNVLKNRITEWIKFCFNGVNYVTSMRVYVRGELNTHRPFFTSEKYLFTKAIENLLNDTKMCSNTGLTSAQMFRLENAIKNNPDQVDPEEELYFNFDKCAYVENMIEKLLLTQNSYPILPIYHDLIFKKNIGSEVLMEPDDYIPCADPITDAVYDLTVPIKSYLASSSVLEKDIIGSLSPYQYGPNLLQVMAKHPHEDKTNFIVFKCPFDQKVINSDVQTNELMYTFISTLDEYPFDSVCLTHEVKSGLTKFIYKFNTHFGTDFENKVPRNIQIATQNLVKWFNEPCTKIDICKTPTNEIFINIHTATDHVVGFYIDIDLFDLAAHNLINV
jgi:hypothetical protein